MNRRSSMIAVTIDEAWPGFGDSFAPDLVVVHLDDVGEAKFTTPPLLVVEVRSPSTALIDQDSRGARPVFPLALAFGRESWWGGSVPWKARRFRSRLI
jgi:hypothetical protein